MMRRLVCMLLHGSFHGIDSGLGSMLCCDASTVRLPFLQADMRPISRQLLRVAPPAREHQPLAAWLAATRKAWRQVSECETLQELIQLKFCGEVARD